MFIVIVRGLSVSKVCELPDSLSYWDTDRLLQRKEGKLTTVIYFPASLYIFLTAYCKPTALFNFDKLILVKISELNRCQQMSYFKS